MMRQSPRGIGGRTILDDKSLAEIRERAENWRDTESGSAYNLILAVRIICEDVPDLIAEVERLTAMTEMVNEDMHHFAEVAEERGVEIARLTTENARPARELGAAKADLCDVIITDMACRYCACFKAGGWCESAEEGHDYCLREAKWRGICPANAPSPGDGERGGGE